MTFRSDMAGDWIPIRTDLLDDPAVMHVHAATGANRHHIVGALTWLWGVASNHTLDGKLHGYTPASIDRQVEIDGFCEALATVKPAPWLVIAADYVEIAKFEDWLDRGAKRRLKKTRDRDISRAQSCRQNVATTGDKVATKWRQSGDKVATTEQNRTGTGLDKEQSLRMGESEGAPGVSLPVPDPESQLFSLDAADCQVLPPNRRRRRLPPEAAQAAVEAIRESGMSDTRWAAMNAPDRTEYVLRLCGCDDQLVECAARRATYKPAVFHDVIRGFTEMTRMRSPPANRGGWMHRWLLDCGNLNGQAPPRADTEDS